MTGRPVLAAAAIAAVVLASACGSSPDATTTGQPNGTSPTTTGAAGGTASGRFKTKEGYEYRVEIKVLAPTQREADVPGDKYKCSVTPKPGEFIVPVDIRLHNAMSQSVTGGSIGATIITKSAGKWQKSPSEQLSYESTYACDRASNGARLGGVGGGGGSLDPNKYFRFPGVVARSFAKGDLGNWGVMIEGGAASEPVVAIALDGSAIATGELTQFTTTTTAAPPQISKQDLIEFIAQRHPDQLALLQRADAGGGATTASPYLTVNPTGDAANKAGVFVGFPLEHGTPDDVIQKLCNAIADYTWHVDPKLVVFVNFGSGRVANLYSGSKSPECQ